MTPRELEATEADSFEIGCCVALSDALVLNYLTPIALHPRVSRLWIVRQRPVGRAAIPNSEFVLTPGRSRPSRWLRMYRECRHLAARPRLRAFVSFNPIPYGLLAALAARRSGRAMHFGFIGADWYRYARSSWGRRLLPVLRRGGFVTATGESMRREMIEEGFDADRIAVLPHSIDLDHFRVEEGAEREDGVVFVGQLIRRKRVDVILRAHAELLEHCPSARLTIVGDGPLRQELTALAASLRLGPSVEFVGAVEDVRPYLERAKIIVISSDGEGFPFALVEGIASGLVPVSTPVGTVADLLQDRKNAMLFPTGSAPALAARLRDLLTDPELYGRLRDGALALRRQFGYEQATKVWDGWLEGLVAQGPTPREGSLR